MAQRREVDRGISGKGHDLAVGELAGRQEGVVERGQLLDLGLSGDQIDWRLREGRLLVLHRGVYAVGHRALTKRSCFVAAVLAAGPDAALSHRTAAEVHGIRAPFWKIELTSPRAVRQRTGFVLHRSPLPGDEVETMDGLQVTTPARTLLDLAAVLGPQQTRRAFEQAEILRLTSPASLPALLDRYRTRRGTRLLRRLVAAQAQPRMTKRELEERFLVALRAAGLPDPLTNAVVAGLEVDCLWPEARLVVELDSRGYHENPVAFERDRERDRKLALAGYRVLRVTWRQVGDAVADVAQLIRSSPV